MILIDTSVWIDHLKATSATLSRLLEHGSVLAHPWVVGELALGNLRRREEVIGLLNGLPQATTATPAEVLIFIERHKLSGVGIGYLDAQLLAATKLTAGSVLWTADRRLAAVASVLGCGFDPS